MAVVNIFHRQLHRRTHRFRGITHVVVRFILRLQAVDNLYRLFDRRLGDINFLEATRQSTVFLKDVAELLIGGRAHHADLAAGEQRFDQVCGINLSTRRGTRPDNGVDLVDKQNAVAVLFELLQQRLETFLKVTAVLGAGQQRANIQRVDGAVGHHFRHIALHNTPGKAFGNRRFTDARLTHQQRVVFAATAQHLDSSLKLPFATDQRVNAADTSKLIEIGGEVFHTFLPACLLFVICLAAGIGSLIRFIFPRAVGDKVHHVETAHLMLTQQIGSLRLLFAKDGDQYVRAGHFAAAGGLNVEYRALQYTLEAERRLRIALLFADGQHRCGLFDEGFEFLTQRHQIDRARFKRLASRWVAEQSQQ